MIKNCFVIMGYGEKTCPKTHRTINLDLTYLHLIKPVLKNLGINCIRCDEITTNLIIDVDLYTLLLKSDLVIADISTLNPNAIYELGVRHALKPHSTIIIAENNIDIPFDLNHIRVFQYHHEGPSISNDEVKRFSLTLENLITALHNKTIPDIDSPLYKLLKINPPVIIEEDNSFDELSDKYKSSETIGKLLTDAYKHMDRNDFAVAAKLYKKSLNISNDDYIVKQLVVCTYKQNESNIEQLSEAIQIMNEWRKIDTIVNADLLAAIAAIYKKRWLISKQNSDLDNAIKYYKKSYMMNSNYYPGINYAFCLLLLADSSENPQEKIANYYIAKNTYKELTFICLENYSDDDYWVNATLEEAYSALNNISEAKRYQMICDRLEHENNWKRKSTFSQVKEILRLCKELDLFISGVFNLSGQP